MSKDGNHLDATEYDELLSVLEGAIVQAREAGIEEYAASLFSNLDANTLKRLVRDAGNLKYLNADDKLLVQRLGDLLAELRDLFSVVVKLPDLETRFPQFWTRLDRDPIYKDSDRRAQQLLRRDIKADMFASRSGDLVAHHRAAGGQEQWRTIWAFDLHEDMSRLDAFQNRWL